MAKKSEMIIREMKPGEWFPAGRNGEVFFLSCCDCGLRHAYEVHVDHKHRVWLRAWKDPWGTRMVRRLMRKLRRRRKA